MRLSAALDKLIKPNIKIKDYDAIERKLKDL